MSVRMKVESPNALISEAVSPVGNEIILGMEQTGKVFSGQACP